MRELPAALERQVLLGHGRKKLDYNSGLLEKTNLT